MTDQRSKTISVRLSWEEYRTYLEACAALGIRSISELARSAMQQLTSSYPARSPEEEELRELRERVSLLSAELKKIAERLDHPAAAEQDGVPGAPECSEEVASATPHPDVSHFEEQIMELRDRVDSMAEQLTSLLRALSDARVRETASAGHQE